MSTYAVSRISHYAFNCNNSKFKIGLLTVRKWYLDVLCLHYFPKTIKKSLISHRPINKYLLWFEHYSKLHILVPIGLQDWTLWAACLTRCFSMNIIKSFQWPIYSLACGWELSLCNFLLNVGYKTLHKHLLPNLSESEGW